MNPIFDTDLYAILGVPPDASLDDIRAARTRLLKRYHPDKGGDSESDADREHWTAATAEVNAAWDVLKDDRKRREYDAYRSAQAGNGDDPVNPPPGSDSSADNGRQRTSRRRSDGPTGNPPPPPRRPSHWRAPRETAAAVILVLGALYSEACFQDTRITSELDAAHAQRAAADVRRAFAALSVAEGRARETARASREASSLYWAAFWDLQKKQIALRAARVGVIDRARGLPETGGAVAGGAGAALAGAVVWLFSKIPWGPARAAADWAREVQEAAESWAAEMERRATARRLNREQRIADLQAAVNAATEVRDHARVARNKASADANLAQRQAEQARNVVSATQSVAERAADRAAETAGDAAFRRTFAAGAWVSAILTVGWAGIRRRQVVEAGM